RGDAASVAYGLLPFGLFETIRQQFIAAIRDAARPNRAAQHMTDAGGRSKIHPKADDGSSSGDFNILCSEGVKARPTLASLRPAPTRYKTKYNPGSSPGALKG